MVSKLLSSIGSLRQSSNASLKFAGGLSACFGFVSDVLQPVAPFALALCLVSLIIFISLLCLRTFGREKRDVTSWILLSLFTFVVTGMMGLMKNSDTKEKRGVLAATIPVLSQLQNTLGMIQKEVSEIQETTSRTEVKVDQILKGVENIAQSGGVILKPKTSEEFYHNAKIHELGGDYAAARRSYLSYFKNDTGKIDPHLRFIKFLKVQEGTAGAREAYQEVTASSEGETVSYTKNLLLPREQRVQELLKYSEQHPDYGPVWYHLSLDYSYARVGNQTLTDRREELKYVKAFLQANQEGKVVKYFVDQELLSEWLADAEQRRKVIEDSVLGEKIKNPIEVAWSIDNTNVCRGTVTISEQASKIQWRPEGGTFKEVKPLGPKNQMMAMAQMMFPVAKGKKFLKIEVQYENSRGEVVGPYAFEHHLEKGISEEARKYLEMIRYQAVQAQNNPGNESERLLYFSNLLMYRVALKEIRYGFDTEVPDRDYKFPSADQNFAPIPDEFMNNVAVKVPKGAQSAVIQWTYLNGEKSEVIPVPGF